MAKRKKLPNAGSGWTTRGERERSAQYEDWAETNFKVPDPNCKKCGGTGKRWILLLSFDCDCIKNF